MKKQNDSDDESAASSDTDSFVHVAEGSTGTNSDSEWERVGSYHSASSDGESAESDEEDPEDEDYDQVLLEDDSLKIPFVTTLPPLSTTTTAAQPSSNTSTTNNDNNKTYNAPPYTYKYDEWDYTCNNDTSKNNNNNNNNNSNQDDLSMSKFVNIEVDDDELTEEVMLAQALSLSLQESQSPSSNNSNHNNSSGAKNNTDSATTTQTPKQDTLTARFEGLNINLEDSLTAIGVSEGELARLALHGVRTVGQLAKLDRTDMLLVTTVATVNESLREAWELAMRSVDRHKQTAASPSSAPVPASSPVTASTPAAAETKDDSLWGYHYLGESVYEQIKEDRILKSAYVLFHEYMECPVAMRTHHPWKRVYHAYLADAAKWNGARGKHRVENLTDTDVYAFLVWRSAESFARRDVTAGPRAIYFSWTQMPMDTWSNTLEIDKIMGEDLRNPTICDRYAFVIKVNLSKLCSEYKGVMHRVQMKDGVMDSNHWLPTSLDEATTIKATNLWGAFEPGSSFFSCVPHGCIVMPNGTIPWDCVDTMEATNKVIRE